jgi:choline-glycine betaine transporter
MEHPGIPGWIRRLGAERRTREVLMAVLLTVAAMVFLATAIFGRDAAVDQAGRDETQTAGKRVNQ